MLRKSLTVILSLTLAILARTAGAAGPVFGVSAAWQAAPPDAGGAATLLVTIEVQPGWHVNSNRPLEEYLIPTQLRLELPTGWSAGEPVYPPHRLASFAFSEGPVAVLEGRFPITVEIHRPSAGPATLRGVVEAQACNDRMCLAPAEVGFALDVAALPQGPGSGPTVAPAAVATRIPAAAVTGAPTAPPPAPETAPGAATAPGAGGLSQRFLQGSLILQLAIVFLAGLALNLTPCVYPLIPITVGFFAAQKDERAARTFFLAVVYVLGMSVTYTALGVTAALTGRLFGAALQSPWVVAVIVAILLALAASMFGAWEIRVPAWATRVSGGRAGVGGALVMGLVVGLVAAPCIGPFVLGLLTYVGQRQDPVLGFSLFFALSLGLGLPYLILAVSTKALERLPNSGAWMLGIRQLFGVLLVALGGWFVRPFLAAPWGDRLVAGLLLAGGFYLLVIARPGHDQPAVDRVMRFASAAVLLAGIGFLPASAQRGAEVAWQPYDETAVTAAIASGRPVILDFYADWCAPCKELDEKTFSEARVVSGLSPFARFKVDLTRADAATEAIRNRFGVLGVPTVAFFNGGHEIAGTRLTGFEAPDDFLRRLQQVVTP